MLAYGDDAHRFEEDFEIELHHGAPARSQSARAAVRHRPDAPPMSTGSTTSAQEAGGVGGGVVGDTDKMLAEQKRAPFSSLRAYFLCSAVLMLFLAFLSLNRRFSIVYSKSVL